MTIVGVGVTVGGSVGVGLSVAVGSGVGSTTRPVCWSSTKVTAAPMPMSSRNKPIAIGTLMVMFFKRGFSIRSLSLAAGALLRPLGCGSLAKERPQTRQRVADSFIRVPQVGQIFVLDC